MKSNNLILFLCILIFSAPGTACASNKNLGESFRATADQFSFNRGQNTINIPLDVAISGWAVNCSRTRAIVWGQERDSSKIGAPPAAKVYLIDIDHEKEINHYTVTRGPYEAIFSQDQNQAIVDDYVIDQSSGEVIGMTEDINIVTESCHSFPGKQSN